MTAPASKRFCVTVDSYSGLKPVRIADAAWLEIRPETGRTHQIRVHLASIGLPILGDALYGKVTGAVGLERPALHARVLGFVHPTSGERLHFESGFPADLRDAVERLREGQGR